MQSELKNFYLQTQSARKIIVVDLGFLGDSVHLIPALWEIKRHYPQAALHVLSSALGCEVLRLAACVEKAWVFPLTSPSPPWWKHWDIIRNLRREKFDLAFNLNGADRSIFLTALTGARWKLAHPGGREHFWNTWLIPNWVPRQDRSLLIFEQRRQMLAACGLTLAAAPEFNLQVSENAARWAVDHIPQNSIHCSINASTHTREWPVRHWAALVKIILREFPEKKIVATASAKTREQERLKNFTDAVGNARVLACPADLTVEKLAALLPRCALHIGSDSGVVHLAMASDVPTFSFFRENIGLAEWAPRGANDRQIAVACPCVNQKIARCETATEAACLANLAPEKAARIILAQLNSLPSSLEKPRVPAPNQK